MACTGKLSRNELSLSTWICLCLDRVFVAICQLISEFFDLFFVMANANFGKSDNQKWRVIYPQYINSNLTIELGRRLPKSKSIADPKLQEIFDVLQTNPKFTVEAYPQKCYCRELDKENPSYRGYVKYICEDSSFKNKRQVLEYVAELIPKLKSRTNPKVQEVKSTTGSSTGTSNQSTANTSGGTGGGGGGKKKNRRR